MDLYFQKFSVDSTGKPSCDYSDCDLADTSRWSNSWRLIFQPPNLGMWISLGQAMLISSKSSAKCTARSWQKATGTCGRLPGTPGQGTVDTISTSRTENLIGMGNHTENHITRGTCNWLDPWILNSYYSKSSSIIHYTIWLIAMNILIQVTGMIATAVP